jgi:hypothetical protein
MTINKDAETARCCRRGPHGRNARRNRAAHRPLLQNPVHGYEPFTPSNPDALRHSLERGDVLLVEGNNDIAGVIKCPTQSTWSHSALYVGPFSGRATEDGEPHVLIEANVGEGVVSAPLSKYFQFHTRICCPVRLTEADCAIVCTYAVGRIGFAYDPQEHPRFDAVPVAAAGAAAMASPADCAWFGRSFAADLLGADRTGAAMGRFRNRG